MDNTELLITNVYIVRPAPAMGGYSPPLDHMVTDTDSLMLGDFNAHHSLWHSGTTDTRSIQPTDSISISSFAVLNADSSTRIRWECRPQFSGCIISICLSYQLVRLAITYDHELRPSAHPYRITDNSHLISLPTLSLPSRRLGGPDTGKR